MAFFVFPPAAPTVLAVSGGGLFPVRRVFCVGRNYADHVREMGNDPTREPPVFFTKPADAITTQPTVPFPSQTKNLHYEGELVVAIGKEAVDVSVDKALDAVFGYTVGCDLTRRDLQAAAKKAGQPWDMGKAFDFSGPVGVIHPVDEIDHPTQGTISLSVNGAERQKGDIAEMIWSVPEIIACLSTLVRLAPGDLIFTGTPAGVGQLFRDDRVEIHVAGVTSHVFTVI
ncbi:fumarylacetoacetate hydrolase family protein [Telmatospirillum sp.]|uniref:fumarylacetoacetate hydrolase family protein n=1 Tax=Telmatospirillum sp. TaxID=2079197 RepID=UPI002843B749|nr:fumarylacetoacetate hydrolase family protein [Telmatospirillum sp.]MDR3439580.1 fumarylacetoacetate hydrolase family protein [Telmatospirillum sp.]